MTQSGVTYGGTPSVALEKANSPIEKQQNQINSALTELGDHLERLRDRLTPVLAPQEAKTVLAADKQQLDAVSPMVGLMQQTEDRILRLTDRVRLLEDQLQI
jgi:hypothetical protein